MDIQIIETPKLDKPFAYSYKLSDESKEEYARKKKRASEIGLHLFILDEDNLPTELKELEQNIIDNYINMDLDIPEDIKQRYIELKGKTNNS